MIKYTPNKLYKLAANNIIKNLYKKYKNWIKIKNEIVNLKKPDDIKEIIINQINLYLELEKKK